MLGVESLPRAFVPHTQRGVSGARWGFSGEHMAGPSASRHQMRSIFRQCAVLAEVSDEALDRLADGARIKTLAKGEALAREGQSPDYFGILLSGHVRAVHFAHDGRPVTMLVGWPGDALGLMAMLANRPIQADIEAAERTEVAVITRKALEAVIATEPRVGLSLLSDCTRQLFDVMGVVKSLSVDVKARIASYILGRIPADDLRGNGETVMELPVTRVELAAQLGTVPETLSRAFASLQDEQIIRTHGKKVTVLDIDALRQFASGEASGRG